MKQIKLMKDHEQDGKKYKAGETIMVTDATYTWLMNIYLTERQEFVNKLNSVGYIFEERDK